MTKLTFATSFRSVRTFPSIELPSVTLLTGVNGAGKIHLLRAITLGHVKADVVAAPQEEVRFFDWSNLVLNDSGQYHTGVEQRALGLVRFLFEHQKLPREQVLDRITRGRTLIPNQRHRVLQSARD